METLGEAIDAIEARNDQLDALLADAETEGVDEPAVKVLVPVPGAVHSGQDVYAGGRRCRACHVPTLGECCINCTRNGEAWSEPDPDGGYIPYDEWQDRLGLAVGQFSGPVDVPDTVLATVDAHAERYQPERVQDWSPAALYELLDAVLEDDDGPEAA